MSPLNCCTPINPIVDPQFVEAAIRDIAGLGYYGIELFGNQIEAMKAHGGLGALLEKYNLPLISAYCGANLSDPRKPWFQTTSPSHNVLNCKRRVARANVTDH